MDVSFMYEGERTNVFACYKKVETDEIKETVAKGGWREGRSRKNILEDL